jgi:hypothetical protein
MEVGILTKRNIDRLDDIPEVVMDGLRALADPVDYDKVPDSAFSDIECWSRTDGVDTYIAKHGEDILFCDILRGEWIGRAAMENRSVATFTIFADHRHRYLGEHLLWTMNQKCLALHKQKQTMDSGPITNVQEQEGYKGKSYYEAALGVWKKAVERGWAEPVRQANKRIEIFKFRNPDEL